MLCPPHGLCLPCRFRRCRDGDTVEVSLPGSERIWAIRVMNVDTPERGHAGFIEAKAFAEEVLNNGDGNLSVWIPMPRLGSFNLLGQLVTFDRLVGDIFIGSEDRLSEMLVHAGHARRVCANGRKGAQRESGDE
jgi:endonuclease YncB( thermonuclease family)